MKLKQIKHTNIMKKDLVKELYVAPEWGLRVVMVERHYLQELSYTPGGAGNDDTIVDEPDLG